MYLIFVRFYRDYLSHALPLIIGLCLLSLIDQAFSVGAVYVWKTIIDDYFLKINELSEYTFIRGMGLMILLWISMAMVSRISKNILAYKAGVLADRTSLDFFEKAYAHLIHLSLNFHETRRTGEVLRQLSKARDDMSLIITAFFSKVVMQINSFVIVTVFFMMIQWQIGMIMLLYLPVFYFVTRHFAGNIDDVQEEINTKLERVHGSVQQALDLFMVVLTFHTQRHEVRKLRQNHEISHECTRQKTIAFQKLSFWQGTLTNLARLSIIAAGGYFIKQGEMTIGEVILLSVWAFFIYHPMYQVSELYALFTEGFNSIRRVETLLGKRALITSPANPQTPREKAGDIVFQEVSFRYPIHQEKCIHALSFHVKQGQSLAIVGPSGSGKSTITKLLPRFYDIEAGAIIIDGVDIREWELNRLRDTIGMVLQDTYLFNDTVYNNIIYGNSGVSQEEAIRSAKQAHAHDFIMKLPQQYETPVGERGVKLSGGEKQRISIARTILKNPSILILDEATSALDSESEKIVLGALQEISRNRTTITIAHRLSTIRQSDQILFCQNGHILERGDHTKLMALQGQYYKYIQLQDQQQLAENRF